MLKKVSEFVAPCQLVGALTKALCRAHLTIVSTRLHAEKLFQTSIV